MKTLTFSIKKEDIIEEVNKTIAYVGAKTLTQDSNEYGHIHLDGDTDEAISRFWLEAGKALLGVGKQFVRYVGEYTYTNVATEEGANDVTDDDTLNDVATKVEANTENIITLLYEFQDTHNAAMDAGIERMCNSYIVWYIAGRWLEMCGMPNEAQSYLATAASFLKTLENMLYSTLHERAAAGKEASISQLGDTVESSSGDGSSEGCGETASNQLGDKVTDIAGDGSSEGSGETASNQLGDKVTDIAGDGSSEGSGETASNQLGDKVTDIAGDGNDGNGKECENTLGITFHQEFGEQKIEQYTIAHRHRRTDE